MGVSTWGAGGAWKKDGKDGAGILDWPNGATEFRVYDGE